MLRLAVMASVKAGDHVALLAEVRSENGGRPEPYGLYLRIRPWTARAFDIQIGRVPPTFGAFPAAHLRRATTRSSAIRSRISI